MSDTITLEGHEIKILKSHTRSYNGVLVTVALTEGDMYVLTTTKHEPSGRSNTVSTLYSEYTLRCLLETVSDFILGKDEE